MREFARLGRHGLHVVQRNGGGDVFHEVETVVHRRDELVDLVAVERRDEGLVQQVDALVRQLVGGLFGALHVLFVDFCVSQIVDQELELTASGNDALRVRVEDFEELALGGHESTEHWDPGNWSRIAVTKRQDSRHKTAIL
ncbi:hypothetical protein PT2222_250070 [Paraburkholderia tropica]